MELTQQQAEEYMKVRKKFVSTRRINLNQPFKTTEQLFSDAHGDIFKLDLRQGSIELNMVNINSRANECFILCRLDIDDKVHKNPDGKRIKEPHIHLYRQGYNGSFAYPAKDFGFTDFSSIIQTIDNFLKFCNIDATRISFQGRII